MNSIKKNRVLIIVIISIIVMILGVLFWNYISDKQAQDKNNNNNSNFVELDNINNIDSVEAKLGSDIKITQGYLLNYTIKKSGTWYMSYGIVTSVKNNDGYSTIRIKNSLDDDNYLVATIVSSKCDVKKNDQVHFVGTIDFATSTINLTKISKDVINYNNVIEIQLNDLINNINQIKDNYFIVNGYLVTVEDKYRLYDTKEAYKEDESFGNYFTISWKEEFPYTGTKSVSVKCKIEDTYKLNECELIK